MSIDLFIPTFTDGDSLSSLIGKISAGYTNAHLIGIVNQNVRVSAPEKSGRIDPDLLRKIWVEIEKRRDSRYIETEAVLRVEKYNAVNEFGEKEEEMKLEYIAKYSAGLDYDPSAVMRYVFTIDGKLTLSNVAYSFKQSNSLKSLRVFLSYIDGGGWLSEFNGRNIGWERIHYLFDDLKSKNKNDSDESGLIFLSAQPDIRTLALYPSNVQ